MTAIAIVGAAARLPGASSLDEYWRLLIEGRQAVTAIPAERWSHARFGHVDKAQPGRSYTFAAGVIEGLDQFDAGFFGISPREAEQIDPQQRWLLETAWEAIQDAALTASELSGAETGVYIGASGTEYGSLRLGDLAAGDGYFMTGTTTSIAANRISYAFDLHGPSFTVDTACSSSLVALKLACDDLRSGRVGAAIAGGVNILLTPYPFIGFSKASMLSPDGRCYAFDTRANGYVRSEGAGVVVLKRLDDALAAGDPIRAVITASGVNSDGRTMGLSLPNFDAQSALLRRIYGEEGVDPESLGFVEAHGTGTVVGDPIEAGALGEVLGARRSKPLPIGSAKTNVGHLEVASGMAGLFKAMLGVEHGVAPPSLNFETANPNIDFDRLNVAVLTKAQTLAPDRRRAGVNSFGFGGTNAHVVLEAAPTRTPVAPADHPERLPPLLISARSEGALAELTEAWRTRIKAADPEETMLLVRGAARRRDHHAHRAALSLAPGKAGEARNKAVSGRTAFVFSGNGSQWVGMGRAALAESPAFRASLERVDAAMRPHLGWSLVERLEAEVAEDGFARTDVAQPLLFAVQVGIVEALEVEGVKPDFVAGHSVGEIAAAWAAGALSLETACRIVVARSHQQQRTQGLGRMAALGLPWVEAEAVAREFGLEVCAENSALSVTVGGPEAAIAAMRTRAREQGWRSAVLPLDYAFHTSVLDPVRADLIADLGGIAASPAVLPLISTVSGGRLQGPELDAEYWWRNIRERVRFKEAIDTLIHEGVRLFVEIGPQAVLQSYMREGLRQAEVEGRLLSSLSRNQSGADPFSQTALEAYAAGYDLAKAPLFNGPLSIEKLPLHPWRRERVWFRPTSDGVYPHLPVTDHPLLGHRSDASSHVWTGLLSLSGEPWLADHVVDGIAVLPAAAMIEMALAAAAVMHPEAETLEVRDLQILGALTVEEGLGRETRLTLEDDGRLRLESRARLADGGWSLNAVGKVARGATGAGPPPGGFTEQCHSISTEAVYATAERLSLSYGPRFRPVSSVEVDPEGAARVRYEGVGPGVEGERLLSIACFDGALQGFLALQIAGGWESEQGESLLPERFGRVRLFAPFGATPTEARIRVLSTGERAVTGSVTLLDAVGRVLATAEDCSFRRVRLSRGDRSQPQTFRFVLTPAPLAPPPPSIDLAKAFTSLGSAHQDARLQETSALFRASLLGVLHHGVCAFAGSDRLYLDSLVEQGRLQPQVRSLLAAVLHALTASGFATFEGDGGWTLTTEGVLGAPFTIWNTVLDDQPEAIAELALVADLDARLPDLLASGAHSVPASIVDHLLFGSPAAQAGLSALEEVVAQIVAAWPANRPIRALLVGLEGAALSGVRRAFAPVTDRLHLQVEPGVGSTELSGLFSDAAVFDVIVGAYVLTRAGPVAADLMATHLVPGGALLTLEPQPNLLWDALFGADPAWWRASTVPDYPLSPMQNGEGWKRKLKDAGLAEPSVRLVAASPWSMSMVGARAPVIAAAMPVTARAPCRLVGRVEPELATALSKRLSLGNAEAEAPAVVLSDRSRPLAERLLDLVTDVRLAVAESPRAVVRVVTRGAQAAAADPSEAAIWGATLTLANEMLGASIRLVDVAPELRPAAVATLLAGEIATGDGEGQVVLAAEGRYALRLRAGEPETSDGASGMALQAARPGLLSSLTWRSTFDEALLDPDAVRIDVRATALNFRDLMWIQDLLPEEALKGGFAGATLGLECAGVVTEVGSAVTTCSLGQRVMAMAPQSLAATATTTAVAVVPIPDGLSFEAAATLPVAFLTVIYALDRLARLEKGERLLVHGAAGAVGMAAIQFARQRGAEIFATAGSPLKRALAHRLGADHVLDSRSLSFADDLRRLTGGEGVDVVLNSLSGEAMAESLALLRPFGRFLELGKRDFYGDTRVGLRPLRNNISYFAVDADRLPVDRPKLATQLLAEVMSSLETGALTSLPYRAFQRSDVVEAFRLMQSGSHLGKLVITPDRGAPAVRPAKRAFRVPAEGAVVVTGGLSGFGLETARWLADRGARRLALIGRRGEATPGAAEALADLRAAKVDVRAYACDVAREADFAAILARVRGDLGPIFGVYHAAAVIEDGLLESVDIAAFRTVLGAKVEGALNLDRLTAADPVEQFILFSSATTLLGAPGQGAYVAANMALEALATRRAAQGRASLAVGWGPIADVGVMARDEGAKDQLARRLSVTPLSAADALAALPRLWESGAPVLASAAVKWEAVRRRLPILATPTYEAVNQGGPENEEIDLVERLGGLSTDEAKAVVRDLLVQEMSTILSSTKDRIDPARSLVELGMDSLMAVELRMTLESRLKINLPLLSLSDTTTVASLAARIVKTLRGVDGDVDEAASRHESLAAPGSNSEAAAVRAVERVD